MDTINFTNVFPDIINCEGTLLAVVESVDINNPLNERLYLKCHAGNGYLFCKVNEAALDLFFQSRLSISEMFRLRHDEYYIYEREGGQEMIFWHEGNDILNSLICGDRHFYTFNKDCRIDDPFTNIMNPVRLYYINGLSAL